MRRFSLMLAVVLVLASLLTVSTMTAITSPATLNGPARKLRPIIGATHGLLADSTCGTERWLPKTLQDPDARLIHMVPVETTVHALRQPKQPANLRKIDPSIRLDSEKQVYTVHALLIGFKRESDSDYHLVLADPTDRKQTMIAEIPAPDCSNQKYAAQFKAAAKAIEAIHHGTPKFYALPKPVAVTVTGVFFFDFIHGQTGVAPNGAEIHPVLEIKQ
ncbi:MAG TPA: hypothetical protein VGK24_09560 [Candidatus Angelobacter sp.]|jgi:hypothetical protein